MPGEEIVAGTAILKVFDWIWDNFGEDIKKSLIKIPQGLEYRQAVKRYAEKIKKQYGTMQIWRMSASTSLENIFTYVNILDKPSAFRHTAKEQLKEIYLGKAAFGEVIEEGKNGINAVYENKKLFILGKPGAGKTTFLKHITLRAIKGKLDLVPFFIPLKHFSESGKSLFEFIIHQFQICDFPHAQPFIETVLKKGKAIVLCDGLDEVNKEGDLRDRVIKELIDSSNKYDKSKFVITCRVAATEYCFAGFTYVEMADFNEDQIKTFIYKWFADEKQLADSFFMEFGKSENNRLHELAKNPLLLTLLCIAFEETLSFPARRSEIYEEALDALLRKWDTSRRIKRDEIYHKLSLGRKSQMFARIAAETFEKKEYLIELKNLKKKVEDYLHNLPPADINEDIDGAGVVKAIEAHHGIFVERSKGIYSFSHLTFQEYYAARYIVEHSRKGTLKGLIKNHLTDPNWSEVFLLTVEMLDEADDFFDIFLSTLQGFIAYDEKLIGILAKAEREASEINFEVKNIKFKPFEARNAVIVLILDTAFTRYTNFALARTLARTIAIARAIDSAAESALGSESALARAIARTLDSESARARYIESVRARSRARAIESAAESALARYIARDSAIESALARAIARTIESARYIDNACARAIESAAESTLARYSAYYITRDIAITRDSAINYHNTALELSKKRGLTDLCQALTNLPPPSEQAPRREWKNFAEALINIMHTHISIEDYILTEEQASRFNNYLVATKLLLDCMKIAHVSDREAIEDNLLRPPQKSN